MKLNGNKPKSEGHKAEKSAKPAREKAPKTGKKLSGGYIALIAALAVVAAVLAGAAVGVNYVNQTDVVFPGVSIDGKDVSGLHLDELVQYLEQNGYDSIGDAAVTARLPLGVSITVRADEVCTETPVTEIALMAYDACKGGSAAEDAMTYLRCRFGGGMALESGSALVVDEAAVRAKVDAAAVEVRMALLSSSLKIGEDSIAVMKGASDVTVDAAGLTAQIVEAFQERRFDTIVYEAEIRTDSALDLDSLYDTVFVECADAYYSEEHEIVPEAVGVSFDMDEARQLWNAAGYGDEVIIPLTLTQPEVTAEQLEALLFRDMLSTMTTSLWGSSGNRLNNVKKASASINEIILMPGEEFSYNDALGKRTAENGYLPAGAYSGGEVVQEYGGGICQVSSTLYHCCLYANLRISARSCHYFPVSYLPAGLDATVSWGGPEYKFVNSREYPIKIVAYVNEKDNNVTVELWGTDTDGSYVEMKYSTWLVYDEEYTDVAIGYKARTWRSVFAEDGTLLSSREESNSYYHYHDEDIKWPEEEPEETEPPAPTEPPTPTEPPVSTEPPVPTPTPAPDDPVSASDLHGA